MNDLVFVMYNLKLQERQQRRTSVEVNELSLDNMPSDDEWLVEKENPVLPRQNHWLKILEENTNKRASDDEDEVGVITRDVRRACKSFFIEEKL